MPLFERVQNTLVRILRWSERYAKTDMVYLMSGGSWLLFEQVASAIFSLALAVAFGHFASQDTYGNYKYALSLSAILVGFSLSGIGTAVTQATARGHEGSLTQGFSLNFRWSGPMTLAGIATALYYYLSGNEFLALSVAAITLALPFLNGFGLFDSFMIGRQEFRRTAIATSIVNIVPTLAVIIALFFLGQRAIFLVFSYLVGSIAANAFFYFQSIRTARNAERDSELREYSFHLSAINVVGIIADKIDSVAVFTILGPVQFAIYAYAIAIPEMIKGLVKNIVPLSMPKFAHRAMAEIKSTLWRRILSLALGIGAISLLYAACAPLIFHILFPVYVGSIVYSQVYVFSIVLTAFISPIISVFQAHKNTKQLYVTSNIGPIVLIILLPIFTYFWGIFGAIASQFVYRGIMALTATWQVSQMQD